MTVNEISIVVEAASIEPRRLPTGPRVDHYVPDHLLPTYQLLERSFTGQVAEQDYLPLLYVLGEKLSFVDCARVVAAFTSRDFPTVLHDIYRCHFTTIEDSARIKGRLLGYELWLVR